MGNGDFEEKKFEYKHKGFRYILKSTCAQMFDIAFERMKAN